MHQPLQSCARSDPDETARAWLPVLEAHGVDLVVQGHDHCYSRLHAKAAPVYVMSVAGPKMYRPLAEHRARAARIAEDTQLYQVIDFESDRLRYRAYSASGRLYDEFALVRGKDGVKTLVVSASLPPERACRGRVGPDGVACVSERP